MYGNSTIIVCTITLGCILTCTCIYVGLKTTNHWIDSKNRQKVTIVFVVFQDFPENHFLLNVDKPVLSI